MAVYKRNPQGNIVKDNEPGRWFYDFVFEGRRYKKSLPGIRTRAQAEKIEEKKRFAVYSGDDLNNLGKTPFKQFVDEIYLPYQKLRIRAYNVYCRVCQVACQFFKNKTLREMETDPTLIERFMTHRLNGVTKRGGKRNPVTVNRDMAILSGIFTLAVKRKYCKVNPCRSIDPLPITNSRRTAVLTPEDEARLIEALSGDKAKYRPIVILGLNTGMRRSEILSLRWEWIDLDRRELTLPGSITKNRKSRTIMLNREAVDVLLQLKEARPNENKVFPNTERNGLSGRTVSEVISKICDQIGLPDVTMHATRHTFNTRLIEQNVNPLHVKELMGHSSLNMTDHYFHANRESMRDAVETLEKNRDVTVPVPEK